MITLRNKTKFTYAKLAVGLIVPIAILVTWQVLHDNNKLPPSQSSSPILIFNTFRELLVDPDYVGNLFISFKRLIIGVIIGSTLGVILGVFTSTKRSIKALLNPCIQFLSGVPVIVWIPFWIMIFGIGEQFKIGLIAVSTFFLVYGSTYQSIVSIDKEYIELAMLYKKKYIEVVRLLYLPYCQYSILGAIRLALIIGWIVIFFVEYSIASEGKEGLGWFIANARGVGKVEEEFVGLISLGILAFITDLFVGCFQKKSIEWKQ